MERSEIVQAYLRTLNLDERALDFTFLSDLVARHVATFAFSSVSCQLRDDMSLEFESFAPISPDLTKD